MPADLPTDLPAHLPGHPSGRGYVPAVRSRSGVLAVACLLVLTAVLSGCSGGSGGDGTPSVTATTTVTGSATGSPATGAPTTPPVTSPSAAPSASASGGTASGPGLCTPSVMTFVVNRDNGAAGTDYFSVTATNASQQPCVTTGFPGVAFVDAAGRQVIQATRDTEHPATTITLAPGDKATATIAAVSAAADESACGTYPALLFTLPDNTDSTKLLHSVYACQARVQAFVAGAGS